MRIIKDQSIVEKAKSFAQVTQNVLESYVNSKTKVRMASKDKCEQWRHISNSSVWFGVRYFRVLDAKPEECNLIMLKSSEELLPGELLILAGTNEMADLTNLVLNCELLSRKKN